MVKLSSVHGPDYTVLPTNAKREFLSAFQEVIKGGYSTPAERKSLMQLAMTLNQIWGKKSLFIFKFFSSQKLTLFND